MSTNVLDSGGTVLSLVSAAVVIILAMPVSAAAPATKDNGVTYEGEGITATKPAHDWIFSRWNLGGGNGFGNRLGAVSLLMTLMLVAYLIIIAVHLLNSIRLKRLDEELAVRVAQGYVEPTSRFSKWWLSNMGWTMGWKW